MLYQNGKKVAMPLATSSGSFEKVYSTEEQVIGRWIDGKPLYRKTVAIVTPETDGGYHIVYEDDDENKPVNIYGYFVSKTLDHIPLNMPTLNGGSSSIYCGYYGYSKYIMAVVGPSFRGCPGYLTIEYIKTTDQAYTEVQTTFAANSIATTAVSASNEIEQL